MRKALPRVSIGMPVRNGEQHLASALESLLAQTYDDFELLVSDNASTDSTPHLLTAAATDDRVQVTRHPTPIPAVDNFNSLISAARGRYFLWAADDDLWDPSFLAKLVALLDADASASLAFCAFANVNPDDPSSLVRRFAPRPCLDSPVRADRMHAYLMDEERDGKANLVYGLVRRNVLASAGGMVSWRSSQWGCDMLTVFRLLAKGRVAWADEILFRKRLSPAEFTSLAEKSPFGEPDDLPVPLRHLPEWHGYLLGYLRIIASTDDLDVGARCRLAAATVRKLARGDREAMVRLARRLRLSV